MVKTQQSGIGNFLYSIPGYKPPSARLRAGDNREQRGLPRALRRSAVRAAGQQAESKRKMTAHTQRKLISQQQLLEAGREWQDHFKVLKEKNLQYNLE